MNKPGFRFLARTVFPALLAGLIASVCQAQNSQTHCYTVGNQVYCQTITAPPPAQIAPTTPLDPSVISRIPDGTAPSAQLLCVQRAAAAGLTREQAIAMCMR